ncbi:hypothetical protein O3M35_004969 [Rhynocoris fuscipes]|uniref:Uncharacterized protein n=1 Tax=Rhynocoris fuscipes TaxID=488301 RepID=A0AAW1DMG7_9HEMI
MNTFKRMRHKRTQTEQQGNLSGIIGLSFENHKKSVSIQNEITVTDLESLHDEDSVISDDSRLSSTSLVRELIVGDSKPITVLNPYSSYLKESEDAVWSTHNEFVTSRTVDTIPHEERESLSLRRYSEFKSKSHQPVFPNLREKRVKSDSDMFEELRRPRRLEESYSPHMDGKEKDNIYTKTRDSEAVKWETLVSRSSSYDKKEDDEDLERREEIRQSTIIDDSYSLNDSDFDYNKRRDSMIQSREIKMIHKPSDAQEVRRRFSYIPVKISISGMCGTGGISGTGGTCLPSITGVTNTTNVAFTKDDVEKYKAFKERQKSLRATKHRIR